MAKNEMPLAELSKHLETLANNSLELWDVPNGSRARLINVSENSTYLVEGPDEFKSILRVHREDYHTERAIYCELEWSQALGEAGEVLTPGYMIGKDGKAVQSGIVDPLPGPRFMVMFEFARGHEPDESQDLKAPFEELGEIAARTHVHSISWKRPEPFERLTWDLDAIFGSDPTWGYWRDAPNVTPEISKLLQKLESTVVDRLTKFGKGQDRYGLIHADMRLANLLIEGDRTWLIDFDDCGWGWYLYDFATGISFIEDHPQIPELKSAWVKGYRKARPLPEAEESEIDSFVMLRRLALLAWIGSHIEAPEPQELAPRFADVTAELAEAYLSQFG
ncbi:MAG: phosphotransferase [Albidovulum sp.]|nr:phosphotransferase [Albidovulum sp.]MDE0531700.1 phosphotransferase [Albidovulum sp.]